MTERHAGGSYKKRRISKREQLQDQKKRKRSYEFGEKVSEYADEYHATQQQQAEEELTNRLSNL